MKDLIRPDIRVGQLLGRAVKLAQIRNEFVFAGRGACRSFF